jgi:hypothetical protein
LFRLFPSLGQYPAHCFLGFVTGASLRHFSYAASRPEVSRNKLSKPARAKSLDLRQVAQRFSRPLAENVSPQFTQFAACDE